MLRRTQMFWLKAGNISNRIPAAVATPLVVETFVSHDTPPPRRLSSSGALRIAKKKPSNLQATSHQETPPQTVVVDDSNESAASLASRYVASWPSVQSAMFVADQAMGVASKMDSTLRGGVDTPPATQPNQQQGSASAANTKAESTTQQHQQPVETTPSSTQGASAAGHSFNSIWESVASQVPSIPLMSSMPTYATVADSKQPASPSTPSTVAERSIAMVGDTKTGTTTTINEVTSHNTSPMVVEKDGGTSGTRSVPLSDQMGNAVSVVGGAVGSAATTMWSCVPSAASLPSLPTPVAATMGAGSAAAAATGGMVFRTLSSVSGGWFQYFYDAASKVTGLIWALKMVAIFVIGCGVVIQGARAVKAVLEVLVLAKKLASDE